MENDESTMSPEQSGDKWEKLRELIKQKILLEKEKKSFKKDF